MSAPAFCQRGATPFGDLLVGRPRRVQRGLCRSEVADQTDGLPFRTVPFLDHTSSVGLDVLSAMGPLGEWYCAPLALQGISTFFPPPGPIRQRLLFLVHLTIVSQSRCPLPPSCPDVTGTMPRRRAVQAGNAGPSRQVAAPSVAAQGSPRSASVVGDALGSLAGRALSVAIAEQAVVARSPAKERAAHVSTGAS